MQRIIGTSLFCAFMLLSLVGSVCAQPPSGALSSPEEAFSAEPRAVRVAFYLIDISEIKDASQTMTVDFHVSLSWHDEELVGRWDGIREVPKSDVWSPDIRVVNGGGLVTMRADVVTVYPDGTAEHRQRYVGQVSVPVHLADFPADEHDLGIHIVATGGDELEFTFDHDQSGMSDSVIVPGWSLAAGKLSERRFVGGPVDLAGFVFEIHVTREAGFYVWKVIFPLAMIVLMSWTVFWIDPARIEAQVAVGATAMLTMITYRFTIASLVPPVSYQTRLDKFTVLSTAIILLALIESIATSRLAGFGRERIAQRMDRHSRWAFPVVYLLSTVLIFRL